MGENETLPVGQDEISRLRARVLELIKENEVLLSLVGGTTPTTTLPTPTVIVQGVKVKVTAYEYTVLAGVICLMLLLWALPMMKPIKRRIESKIYKIFPVITVINFVILATTLDMLSFVKFNDLFFMTVQVADVVIESAQSVMMAFAALLVLILFWKFKDRILETLGVDNPTMVIGEFRDWATCWSMKRFYPIEVFVWKVEGLPGLHLHQFNDVFVEVTCGYNNTMRTRVHNGAGHSCMFKESIQLNFDQYDKDIKFYLNVKNQDLMGASDIASVQLGATQVQRLLQPAKLTPSQRTLGWGATAGGDANSAWAGSRFQPIDLIPAGQIFLRFDSVTDEERGHGPSYGKVGATC